MRAVRRAFLQQKAKEGVREIVLYIADDNLKAAEAFRLALERVRLTLADLPEMGRVYNSGKHELKGLRMLPVPNRPPANTKPAGPPRPSASGTLITASASRPPARARPAIERSASAA
jgi:plasmid stabilization system protein ParE